MSSTWNYIHTLRSSENVSLSERTERTIYHRTTGQCEQPQTLLSLLHVKVGLIKVIPPYKLSSIYPVPTSFPTYEQYWQLICIRGTEKGVEK